MYIFINHDKCKHASAYSDLCLAKTMRHPFGHENYCMAEIRDDGKQSITVILTEAGVEHKRVFESEAAMKAAAFEGVEAFIPE